MNVTDNTTTIGGHRCQDTGMQEGIQGVAATLWRCVDCDRAATYNSFDAGTRGCPARPESLDYLSLCPGGELCRTHPDTDSPEWAQWQESTLMSVDEVPHYRCAAADMGIRASRQWIAFADKIGLKLSAWAASQAARVGEGGGIIAELTHRGETYHVIVTRVGNLAAHPGNDHNCQACTDLHEKGLMP